MFGLGVCTQAAAIRGSTVYLHFTVRQATARSIQHEKRAGREVIVEQQGNGVSCAATKYLFKNLRLHVRKIRRALPPNLIIDATLWSCTKLHFPFSPSIIAKKKGSDIWWHSYSQTSKRAHDTSSADTKESDKAAVSYYMI